MEKRTGWGGQYLASQRNGEWEYRVFTPHMTPNTSIELTVCFESHKAQASNDCGSIMLLHLEPMARAAHNASGCCRTKTIIVKPIR
jgi:hypothetical protein